MLAESAQSDTLSTAPTFEDVWWAYKLLLLREPENVSVVQSKIARLKSIDELIVDIVSSDEYRARKKVAVGISAIAGAQ